MAQHTVRISPGSFTGPEQLPEGRYLARIADAELFNSSLKGTPGIGVSLRIMSPKAFKGEKIRDNLWLTPAAGRMLTAKLSAADIKFSGEDFDLDLDDLVGKTVVINVKHQQYEGETRAQVSSWKHHEGAEESPVSDVTPPEMTKEDPKPETDPDDDIPF